MYKIHITGRRALCKGYDTLRSREKGSVAVQYTFDGAWDGLVRTAVFKAGDRACAVLLGEDNVCTIPWEVLQTPHIMLYAGVCGVGEDEMVVLRSDWVNLGQIEEGAGAGEKAVSPTLTMTEQAIAAAGEVAAAVTAATDAMEAAQCAQTAAENARDSAAEAASTYPYIGENGSWFIGGEDTTARALGVKGDCGAKGEMGPRGETGEKGAPGYTPVRGVDYWTMQDKTEIVAEVSGLGLSVVDGSLCVTFDEEEIE